MAAPDFPPPFASPAGFYGLVIVIAAFITWLTWNLSLSDRYLSNPVPGRKTNDFLYTTGLGIAFAQ